jgi:hypothetical protein
MNVKAAGAIGNYNFTGALKVKAAAIARSTSATNI